MISSKLILESDFSKIKTHFADDKEPSDWLPSSSKVVVEGREIFSKNAHLIWEISLAKSLSEICFEWWNH